MREPSAERPSPRQQATARSRRRHGRRFALDIRNIACLVLLVVLGGVLILAWNLASHGQEVVALGLIALGILFGAAGAGWAAAAGLSAGAVLLLPLLPQFLPRLDQPAAGCRFSVLSFNTKLTRAPSEPAVAALLARHAADVLLLQEVMRPQAMMSALRAEPAFARHHMLADPSGATNLIASRFPIEPLASAAGQLVLAHVGARPLRFLTGVGPKEFLGNGDAGRFAEALDRTLGNTALPLVLGMDLNAGARSRLLLGLRRHLRDAHGEAGWGFGFTFPTGERRMGMFGPWLRLDYLLHDARLGTAGIEVIAEHAISTHHPLRAELVLTGVGDDGRPC